MQRPKEIIMPVLCSLRERHPIAFVLGIVDRSPPFEEHPGDGLAPVPWGPQGRRPAISIPEIDLSSLGKQQLGDGLLPVFGSPRERRPTLRVHAFKVFPPSNSAATSSCLLGTATRAASDPVCVPSQNSIGVLP